MVLVQSALDLLESPRCFYCFKKCELHRPQYMGNDHPFCSSTCINSYLKNKSQTMILFENEGINQVF